MHKKSLKQDSAEVGSLLSLNGGTNGLEPTSHRSRRKLTKPVPYRVMNLHLTRIIENSPAVDDARVKSDSRSNSPYLQSFLELEDDDDEEEKVYLNGTPAVDLIAGCSGTVAGTSARMDRVDFLVPSVHATNDCFGGEFVDTATGDVVDIMNGCGPSLPTMGTLNLYDYKENINDLFVRFPNDSDLSSRVKDVIMRCGRMKCFVAGCTYSKLFTYPGPFIKHLRTHQTFKRESEIGKSRKSKRDVRYNEEFDTPEKKFLSPKSEPIDGDDSCDSGEEPDSDEEYDNGSEEEKPMSAAKSDSRKSTPKTGGKQNQLMDFFRNSTRKFRLNQSFDLSKHPFFAKFLLKKPLDDMEITAVKPLDMDTFCSDFGLIPESCHRLDGQDPLPIFKGQALKTGHALYVGGGVIHTQFLPLQSLYVLVSVCSLPHLTPSPEAGLLQIYQVSSSDSTPPVLTKVWHIPYGTVWAMSAAPLTEGQPDKHGLLMVASCESGVLPVYRIPPVLVQLADVLCTPSPCVELKTRVAQGSSICVSWSPFRPNTLILAGFSSGMVCVWDLASTVADSNNLSSPLQVLPFWSIMFGDSCIRSVEWLSSSKVIFVNLRGDVSMHNILRDECLACLSFQVSGVITVKFIPPPHSGIFHLNSISKKIATVRSSDVSFNSLLDGLLGCDKSCALGQHNSAVWAYSFDSTTGQIFTVDEEGSVQLSYRHWLAPSNKYQLFIKDILMKTSVSHKCPVKSFNDCFSDLQCSIDLKFKNLAGNAKTLENEEEDALDLLPTAALFTIDHIHIGNKRKICFGGQSGFLFILDVS